MLSNLYAVRGALAVFIVRVIAACAIIAFSVSACTGAKRAGSDGELAFIDDDGKAVMASEPARRIISLYGVHTENIFALGGGGSVIGVQASAVYPPEAGAFPQYNYAGDPEYVIAANPDLVLIRPFIRRQSPDYIAELERAGIRVVSLYPERLEDFDEYIMRLSLLIGRKQEAEEKLIAFHVELEALAANAADISFKKKIFFEATENEVRTAAAGSLPAQAIEVAGGINIAAEAQPIRAGSSIAAYGIEKLLENAGEIDAYIVQQGAMNQTKTSAALAARPGFNAVKAVREGCILFIDEKLISAPTFRYPQAIRDIQRFLYE
jgi:iron complex transport system substrate-binding protein